MDKEALAYLAAAATATIKAGEHGMTSDALVIPKEGQLRSLEEFKPAPDAIRADPRLQSSASFIDYVKRFITSETSVYLDLRGAPKGDFGREVPAHFMAVLDHHGRGAPAWGRHRATFVPDLSLEWNAWRGLHDGGQIAQRALIAFIEDHFTDIVTPDSTAVLNAVQKFELVEKHTYESQQNLDNGNVALTFIKASVPKTVEFPHRLTIAVPVYENEAITQLVLRLRFEASEGALRFRAQFVQDPERTQRNALRVIAQRIREGLAGAQMYEGGRGQQ